MRRTDARLLVLGGGLAGSLLVDALERHGWCGRLEVVDRRAAPTCGRRWAAFAEVGPGEAQHGFARLRVVAPSGVLDLVCRDHRYVVHDGDVLQRRTDDVVRALGGTRTQAEVREVVAGGSHALVRTSAGDLTGDLVLDSVGRPGSRPPTARMRFLGWHVRAPARTFDPDVLTLMDFRVPQRGQVRFVYVLPESDDRALIELTAFTPGDASLELDETARDLEEYVSREVRGPWRTVAVESGTVDLRVRHPRRRRGRVMTIGAPAGLVRAGTGYGYALMRADADRVAARLARGRRARGVRRRWRHAAMDAVLLRLVVTEPDQVVVAFDRLFAVNPVDRVVRFLDERSSLVDEVQIVASLPVRPFLRAAVSVVMRPRGPRAAGARPSAGTSRVPSRGR